MKSLIEGKKAKKDNNKVSLMFKSENLRNNKFWTITRSGKTTTVKFGRMGAKTRKVDKEHKTED